ncbi:recombinase family protein [Actinoplanes sp. NPDC049548]|uniref:recombinase family protein n=1 Tax=Actinoplanes sp. NPDC049548 TaxID=3155152 RepID=UPI003419F9F6
MRLLGAIRLSRHRGEGDPSTSPERQGTSIEAEAASRGGEVVGWARDLDVSAITLSPFERPDLGGWLRDRSKDFDGIVWSRLDRAVRSMADLHELARWATDERKVLIFASGPGGSSMMLDMRAGPLDPIPHLIVTILAFAAQMEAQAIQERNRDTKAFMRRSGRWGGGMHPYHLMPEQRDVGWWLVPNPETGKVVVELIERVLQSQSKLSIVDDFNARKIPSPREYRLVKSEKVPVAPVEGDVAIDGDTFVITPEHGDAVRVRRYPKHAEAAVRDGERVKEGQRLTLPILWNPKTAADILRSRGLMGQTELGGKPFLGPDGMPVQRAEPLINRETWDRLQRVLDEQGRVETKPRTRGASVLLGVGFCIICDEKIYYRDLKYKGGPYAYYGCRSAWGYLRRQAKQDRCSALGMPAEVVEDLVEREFLSLVGDLEVMENVVVPGQSHAAELADAMEAYKYLQGEAATKPKVLAAALQPQIAQLEERITRLSEMPETEDRVEAVGTGSTYREVWEGADVIERRRLLLEAGVKVRLGRTREDEGDVVLLPSRDVEEEYAAMVVASAERVSVALHLVSDLAERVSKDPSKALIFRQDSL